MGTLTVTTIAGHWEFGSFGNEVVFHILQSPRTRDSPLDGFVSYLGNSLTGGLAPQLGYSQRILQPQPNGHLSNSNIFR